MSGPGFESRQFHKNGIASIMTIEKLSVLLTFAQNERFSISRKVKSNLRYQAIFIAVGAAILSNYQGISLEETAIPFFGSEIKLKFLVPLIPIILVYQFISFGYLLAHYINNGKAIKVLMDNLISIDAENQSHLDGPERLYFPEEHINLFDHMARSFSLFEPFYRPEIFNQGGKPLRMFFNFIVIAFIVINHGLVYIFLHFIFPTNWVALVMCSLTVTLYFFLYRHFAHARDDVPSTKIFVRFAVGFEIITFLLLNTCLIFKPEFLL